MRDIFHLDPFFLNERACPGVGTGFTLEMIDDLSFLNSHRSPPPVVDAIREHYFLLFGHRFYIS